jgi:hypothetical protein
MADGQLFCFGDDGLAAIRPGRWVRIAIHDIAGGPMLAEFGATVRPATCDDIDSNTVLELVEHVPLGLTTSEVERHVRELCEHRPLVRLEPP